MSMRNPPHPGEHLREDYLVPLGITVTEGAKALGVTRAALSEIVNGKRGISPEMAIRLSKALGGRAELWLGLQRDYDLAQAMQRESELNVSRVWRPEDDTPAPAA